MLTRRLHKKKHFFVTTRKFCDQKSCVLIRHPGVENAVTRECFEIRDEKTTRELKNGEAEIETICLSVDPYMRCRFDGDTHPQLPQYVTPFRLNEPLDGGGIGRIIRSKVSNLKPKDYVVMPFVGYPWKTRCVLNLSDINSSTESELGTFHIAANDVEETQVSHLLGVVGMPGLTAYCGIVHASNISCEKQETVVISAAAGAVGSIAGQIARTERGARVVGICGSEEKCKILTETLGFDVAINYKSPEFESCLSEALNDSGFDVYFDSVGGLVSERVLQYANLNARIPICGQIASYEQNISYDSLVSSDKHFSSSKLRDHLRSQRVERFRYLVLDYKDFFQDALNRLKLLCRDEKILPLESVTEGFRPHEAFVDMMSGKNIGKAVIKI